MLIDKDEVKVHVHYFASVSLQQAWVPAYLLLSLSLSLSLSRSFVFLPTKKLMAL